MRVAELVEETAEGVARAWWRRAGRYRQFVVRERHGKGCRRLQSFGHPTGRDRARGYRFSDKEFEVLMAMWMGLPVGVRRACPTAQSRQQADIWGVHGGMTCGGASEGHAVRSAMARRHNELAKQLWAALRAGGMM